MTIIIQELKLNMMYKNGEFGSFPRAARAG
jgi:hypothetical protein